MSAACGLPPHHKQNWGHQQPVITIQLALGWTQQRAQCLSTHGPQGKGSEEGRLKVEKDNGGEEGPDRCREGQVSRERRQSGILCRIDDPVVGQFPQEDLPAVVAWLVQAARPSAPDATGAASCRRRLPLFTRRQPLVASSTILTGLFVASQEQLRHLAFCWAPLVPWRACLRPVMRNCRPASSLLGSGTAKGGRAIPPCNTVLGAVPAG